MAQSCNGITGNYCSIIFPRCSVLDGSESEWEALFKVNVLGTVNTLQAFVPNMAAQPESSIVIVTGSIAGVVPGNGGKSHTRFSLKNYNFKN